MSASERTLVARQVDDSEILEFGLCKRSLCARGISTLSCSHKRPLISRAVRLDYLLQLRLRA